ncbi:MAG TPA: SAM-dependent DNA methyltransferase, partial [Acidobacteria bacterium]|nr:SAM-dependent DNA methyltransferase [Acidobacteriota bacterium]
MWKTTPLHLMGAKVGLDERKTGIRGAARLSPHSLLQQFLNRSDDHLWGVVSNGLKLRILRDSVSLTRQAYVEFDLEALFNGEVFPDFILLYRVAHASRFSGERPEECLLERWIAAARDEGIRALDQLRDGVETALTTLGTGFLRHPENRALRQAVEAGGLGARDLYRYLLRLVYRLLFLFVAEDRDLLLVPGTPPEARDRYLRFYSTARLRDLASRPVTPGNTDLWEGLVALMRVLGRDEGEARLGLPGLGSFLWATDSIGPLVDADLANEDLLAAIRGLSYVSEDGALRRIDFANLGAEELGSVYESLLELHPSIEDRAFVLGAGAGSERKTTGSYYTPTELISELLDSALDPVLEAAASTDNPEKAILNLKVVDPAAGSGHFLVAAAHRIGKKLAEVRTGEPEPPEDAYRTAVRDVVSRCLFAVDLNDLAVELCKVSLWLEALEPGKPLSFLDHHILAGNSLFGATPAAIADGIPNEAFDALTGDDKKVVAELKKRNRRERAGQEALAFESGETVTLGSEIEALEEFADEDLETVRAKERMLAEWKASEAYEHARLVADAWCAAFAIEKRPGSPPLTDAVFRRLRDEGTVDPALRQEIERLRDWFGFFHWHLAFPQVFRPGDPDEPPGWSGGFDVVLGNPPWDKIEFKEREWFATRAPEIAGTAGAERKRMIAALETGNPALWRAYQGALRSVGVFRHFLANGGNYPLCGRGRMNTYAVFAELMRRLAGPRGRVGVIVPTGIATDDTTKHFFADLVDHRSLVSLFDFENRRGIFPGVHRSYKFCLLTLTGSEYPVDDAEFCFFALGTGDLRDPE